MKRFRPAFLLLFFFSVTLPAIANDISGKITTEDGEPIPFAVVQVKGTSDHAITNGTGNFTLSSKNEINEITIVISSVGYKKKELQINVQKSDLVIELQEDIIQLDDIVVTGEINNPNERFVQGISKLPVKLKYQSQSMALFTNEFINTQQINSVEEIVNYAPGFHFESSRGNQFPVVYARGQRASYLINGLRIESNRRDGDGIFDFNSIENVQFINGSSSIGFGNTSSGGAINMVTKQARFNNEGYIFVTPGSFGRVKAAVDKGFLLTDDLSVRLNGSFRDGQTFRDGVDFLSYALAPSVSYRINEDQTIRASYIYNFDRSTPDKGQLVADSTLLADEGITVSERFAPLPQQSITNDFVGFDEDFQDLTTQALFLNYDYRINDKVSIGFNGGIYDKFQNRRGINNVRAYADTDGDRIRDTFNRSTIAQQNESESYTARLDLIGMDMKTGQFIHNFQLSFDYWTNENSVLGSGNQSRGNGPLIDQIDLLNPIFNSSVESLNEEQREAYYFTNFDTRNQTNRDIWGATLQHQLNFNNRIRLNLGGRFSWGNSFNTLIQNIGTDSLENIESDRLNFSGFTPSAALFYDINKQITLFTSYSNTFDETSIAADRVTSDGEVIGNEVIEQIELGARSSFFNKRLATNLTFYSVFNDNVAVRAIDLNGDPLTSAGAISPDNPNGEYFLLVDEERRRGAELNLQGKVNDNLSIQTSYSYYEFFTRADINNDEAVFSTTDYNPTHSGNILARYTWTEGKLNGFSAGASAHYVGDRSVTTRGRNSFTYTNPAYTTYSIFAAYAYKKWDVNLKVQNVTNTEAVNSFGTTFVMPISPMNFDVMLKYNF